MYESTVPLGTNNGKNYNKITNHMPRRGERRRARRLILVLSQSCPSARCSIGVRRTHYPRGGPLSPECYRPRAHIHIALLPDSPLVLIHTPTGEERETHRLPAAVTKYVGNRSWKFKNDMRNDTRPTLLIALSALFDVSLYRAKKSRAREWDPLHRHIRVGDERTTDDRHQKSVMTFSANWNTRLWLS